MRLTSFSVSFPFLAGPIDGAVRPTVRALPLGAVAVLVGVALAVLPPGLKAQAALGAPAVATATPAVATPVVAAPSAAAQAPGSGPAPAGALDGRIESLKASVLQLNRDLLVLEEELLFPASTQMAVFVSMDVGQLFALESVQVRLGDRVVANHLYTPNEVAALHRGGVQRLYLGNLKTGRHELTAYFTGQGPHSRDYRRATTVQVEKAAGPRYVELRIEDSTGKLQPEFKVKVWE